MLRGFRKPYKKLFDGEVFTTVRLRDHIGFGEDGLGRTDVIGLYPRSKRYLRLGKALIVSFCDYDTIGVFADHCTEEFARYDAELPSIHYIKSLYQQAKRRKLEDPWVLVYTYLWTEKQEGYYEAKEGMQE